MTKELLHIKAEFNENAANFVEWYALDQETLRRAQLWQGQQKETPTARAFSDWIAANGGRRDRADGPAYIETRPDGRRREEWYSQDQLDRADGPAIIETETDGRRREAWYSHGQLDRADGPAIIATGMDGSRYEAWYNHGEFIKEETVADPSNIPGISVFPASPSGP